jgi:uncharacterized protein YegL
MEAALGRVVAAKGGGMGRGRIGAIALLAGLAALGTLAGAATAQGTVAGDVVLSAGEVACDGSIGVTVRLEGETGIAGSPADVVLVLDRSGSMAGQRLADLKAAANGLIDRLDTETDGQDDGVVAGGSRIGVVSFGTTATVDASLTANAGAAAAAVDALVASGSTATGAAIGAAQGQLAATVPANAKVMVVVTDGDPSDGTASDAAAATAREAGTEVFTIGVGIAAGSAQATRMAGWATDPDSEHAYVAPTSADLDAIFDAIGIALTVPAATGVEVVATVTPSFTASGAATDLGGVVADGNTLTWTIDELGTEVAELTFTATHVPSAGEGVQPVFTSITYSDDDGATVTFPSPTVDVTGCPVASRTCAPGVDCELPPTPLPSFGPDPFVVTADAGPVDTTTLLSLFALDANAPPAGVCPGFVPVGPGAEVRVLPLSDRLVVTVAIPKSVRQLSPNNGLARIDTCLGTNLPFPTRGGGTSVLVGGVHYGLLPDCPKKGTPATPCTLSRQSVGGGARLVFEVRTPYDPSWWNG